MKQLTKERIFAFALGFVQRAARNLPQWEIVELKQAYPFYPLFLSDNEIVGFKKERSLTTRFGQGFYPELARIVAEDSYDKVYREHGVRGELNSGAYEMLEQIVTELRHRQRVPDHSQELRDILESRGGGLAERVAVCDVFIEDFRTGPLCLEIKGPSPNLDTASGAKRNLLYFQAIMNRLGHTTAQGYLGFYYNPWVTRQAYSHWATKQIMDLDSEVLMGAELWDFIGGPGTLDEILPVLEAVRLQVFGA